MTKKAMISQPMAGKTEQEIRDTREKAIATLEKKGYSVVNTLSTDEWYSPEKNAGTWSCTDTALLSREVTRKHEPLPCRVFL